MTETAADKKAARRAYLNAWRAANPDKVREQTARARAKRSAAQRDAVAAYQREWWAANRDRKAEYDRDYAARKPEAVRAVKRAWAERNPDKVRENRRTKKMRRRQLQQERGYRILPSEIRRLRASPCAACGAAGQVEIDHVIPLARGGRHSIGNLQPLCRSCNATKRSRLQVEWRYGRSSSCTTQLVRQAYRDDDAAGCS